MSAALAIQQAVLAVPDFTPEFEIWLDFETYYDADYSLTKLTTSDYVRDDRFEMIGVGIDDGEDQVWMEEAEFAAWAKTVPWEKCAVGAHNTMFDGFILSERYDIHPGILLDTQSMARTFGIEGGVSLANLAERLGVGHKGFEVLKAKGKRRKDFTDEEYAQYGLYCLNDTALAKAIYQEMISRGFPEPELYLIDATLRLFTEPQLVLDEPMLRRFLAEELQRKAGLLARIEKDKSIVASNDKFAEAIWDLGVDPPKKISPKTGKEAYAFAKTDSGMQELLEHDNDEVRWLAEARIAIKSTQSETRAQRFLKLGENGQAMPVGLKYYGAHTGRWSATERSNFQNLQRTNKKKPERGMLKKSLCAQAGFKVVAADSGAIEARTTAWVSGHTVLMDQFRTGADIYSSFASEVFGRKIDRKKNPEDEAAGFLGKVCVLGLGYGMGFPKLADTLLKGAMGGPPIQLTEKDADAMNVDLNKFLNNSRKVARTEGILSRLSHEDLLVHCACAERLVSVYREKNEAIVSFWGLMDQVIETMAEAEEGDEFFFGPNNCLVVVRHGIRLPNGLMLRYPGLRHSEEYDGYSYLGQYGKQRVKIYGGLATENVVQALARIIIGEQWMSIQAKYRYRAALSTHDEIVVVPPDDEAQIACRRLIEEMKIAPSWAQGLPLTAEGGYHQSYGFAK